MATILYSSLLLVSLAVPAEAFLNAPVFHGVVMGKSGTIRSSLNLRSVAGLVMAEKKTADELSRRTFLLGLSSVGVASTVLALPNVANALNGTTFEDTDRAFSLALPPGWIQGTAEFPGASKSPSRPRIVSFLSPEDKDVNLAIVSYYVQPDQSKLGALGTIEDVARTILGTAFNLDSGAHRLPPF